MHSSVELAPVIFQTRYSKEILTTKKIKNHSMRGGCWRSTIISVMVLSPKLGFHKTSNQRAAQFRSGVYCGAPRSSGLMVLRGNPRVRSISTTWQFLRNTSSWASEWETLGERDPQSGRLWVRSSHLWSNRSTR